MACLQHLPRSLVLPMQSFKTRLGNPSCRVTWLGTNLSRARVAVVKAVSGSAPSTESNTSKMEEKSETYSEDMTAAMGAGRIYLVYTSFIVKVLTYRHELGMNYDFILPDLIVGSCLQTPKDVDKLRSIGVKTIFCLQQDSDLEYFGVDIASIREYANKCGDIQHLRAEIRDFDAFDLRKRLPEVVSKLQKAINRNGGVTYIHCTAGLGRAPATALAYMFWVQDYKLSEAHKLLVSKRPCFPKLDAIKSATADILTGLKKKPLKLTWYGEDNSSVEISGLDIGWGQRIPLTCDEEHGLWNLHRELPFSTTDRSFGYRYSSQVCGFLESPHDHRLMKPDIALGLSEGHYEYKYIVDGEWICNEYEPMTSPNKDGHVNNYVEVSDDQRSSESAAIRARLTNDESDLSPNERLIIRQFLEAVPDED